MAFPNGVWERAESGVWERAERTEIGNERKEQRLGTSGEWSLGTSGEWSLGTSGEWSLQCSCFSVLVTKLPFRNAMAFPNGVWERAKKAIKTILRTFKMFDEICHSFFIFSLFL